MPIFNRLFLFSACWLVLLYLIPSNQAFAQIRIAMVDMQFAINNSEAGLRSKKILETRAQKSEAALKKQQGQIVALEGELKNSVLLNDQAKQQKQQELEQRVREFNKNRGLAQQEFQADEQRYTDNIFKDLRGVIQTVAEKGKYDLVVERGITNGLLYTNLKITDITQMVVEEYNKIQSLQ